MVARRSFVAALAVLAIGCASESQTCTLDTDALMLWVNISDLGTEVEVEIEIEPEDGSTTLELCRDRDSLTVNGVAVEPIRVFGEQYYRAVFSAPADHYSITLERKDAQSATLEVEMPPGFEITAPGEGSSHSRAANIDVSWSSAWDGGQIQVALLDEIGSSCVDGIGYSELVDDLGSHPIPAGVLSSDGAQECDLDLVLTRALIVEHPKGMFAGGETKAYVSRSLVLHSTP